MEYINLFLMSYMVIFIQLVFLIRMVLLWKRTGINAHKLLTKEGPYGKIGTYFKLITYFNVIAVIVFVFFPKHYYLLAPFSWLELIAIKFIGIVLLVVTLPLICLAQAQMGNSWRINIDDTNKTDLVTKGLFSYCRNPIFLFMKLNMIATFLVLPNGLTFAVIIAGCALIDVQVSMEEQHLIKLHPTGYADYCATVNRWF